VTPSSTRTNTVSTGGEYLVLWLARHWLLLVNLFFLVYVGLPFIAPLLLTAGLTGLANTIYRLYALTCHQIPSRAYYIAGEQVAVCHRDAAIYVAILAGGLVFGLVRHRLKPLPVGWYLLLILPMALDGGLQMLSEWQTVISLGGVWVLGIITLGGVTVLLYRQKKLSWHWGLILGSGLLVLLYLQIIGPYHSNLLRRTITGALFGFSTVWLAYPYFEEAARETWQLQRQKLGLD
jgi:uncharacterized membrane protein